MVHVLTTSYNMFEIGDTNMVFRWSIESNKSIPLEFSQKKCGKNCYSKGSNNSQD